MGYRVKYGFSDDLKLLEEFYYIREFSGWCHPYVVRQSVCFDSFLYDVSKRNSNKYLMYSIECSAFNSVIKLIKELNHLLKGTKITLVNKKRVGFVNLVNGQTLFYKERPKSGIIIPIYDFTLLIEVNSESLVARSFLQYLIMTTIRILCYREEWFKYFYTNQEIKKEQSILNKIIMANNLNSRWGHCLYESYINDNLTRELLLKSLDISNMEKVVKEIKNYSDYTQTIMINLIKKGI